MRHLLQVANARLRVRAAVRLDEPDDDVHALAAQFVCILEHPVALAHTGRRPDVHAEPRASLFLDAREYRLSGRRRRRLHSERTLLLHRVLSIKREVEFQDVDDGLAEEPPLPPGRVRLDRPTDVRL